MDHGEPGLSAWIGSFRFHRYDVTRRVNGYFSPEDDQWTALSDLFVPLGVEADLAEYLPVEDRFVAGALLLFSHMGAKKARLAQVMWYPLDSPTLLTHPSLIAPLPDRRIRVVPLWRVGPILRACLPEQRFWCVICRPGIDLATGFDYYVHVRVATDHERCKALVRAVGLVAEDWGWD